MYSGDHPLLTSQITGKLGWHCTFSRFLALGQFIAWFSTTSAKPAAAETPTACL